jgi:lysophospholipase L1-like esterase
MNMTTNSVGTARRMALVLAALAIAACDAANEIVDELDDIGNTAEVHYYLSLGDSLSVGVQPNGSAVLLPTNDGYTDQLYNSIRPGFEAGGNLELRHNKLGCPGEDIDKMTNGGSCVYLAGSQLDAAVDFLRDNGDRVHLVTIDMGGNDFRNEGCVDETMVDLTCANTISAQIYTDLTTVLTTLQNAADLSTTIVGMNYYNPYLATWLLGDAGQVVAVRSAEAVSVFNGFLGTAYMDAGIPMADVSLAFESDEFAMMVMSSQPPPNEILPVSVNNICEMTYMCDLVRGPDIHANDAGYSLIAATIEAAIP